jgi:hypothetical protein
VLTKQTDCLATRQDNLLMFVMLLQAVKCSIEMLA